LIRPRRADCKSPNGDCPSYQAGATRITTSGDFVLVHGLAGPEQAIRNIKDSTGRADAFEDMVKNSGATVKERYWTLGQYDIVPIVEAPDDVSMSPGWPQTGLFSLLIARLAVVRVAFARDQYFTTTGPAQSNL
jgi:uncharacterized protein with GYD domain